MDDPRKYRRHVNLKPLRKRLENVSKETSLRLDIVQQDYILSWILVGLFEHPLLKAELIFKGGTALKKCYFGNYRFSEDLDFSAPTYLPKGDLLFGAIKQACEDAQHQMNVYAPIRLSVERYEERDPHPREQEAFKISAQFPWQSQPLTTAMIEISRDEAILLKPTAKRLLHNYGEPIEMEVVVYSLEEIILEKLRAILQHTKKLHERDWSRSRARDYYDLWRIFGAYEGTLDLDVICRFLPLKCSSKGVTFKGSEDFFDEKMIAYVEKTWDHWLGPLVPQLPKCEIIVGELRPKIERLIALALN